jgi:hypothetical protein
MGFLEVQSLSRFPGLILTADDIAEAVAPWMVGRTRDVSSTYSGDFLDFLILIGIPLLGATVVEGLRKRGSRG